MARSEKISAMLLSKLSYNLREIQKVSEAILQLYRHEVEKNRKLDLKTNSLEGLCIIANDGLQDLKRNTEFNLAQFEEEKDYLKREIKFLDREARDLESMVLELGFELEAAKSSLKNMIPICRFLAQYRENLRDENKRLEEEGKGLRAIPSPQTTFPISKSKNSLKWTTLFQVS